MNKFDTTKYKPLRKNPTVDIYKICLIVVFCLISAYLNNSKYNTVTKNVIPIILKLSRIIFVEINGFNSIALLCIEYISAIRNAAIVVIRSKTPCRMNIEIDKT